MTTADGLTVDDGGNSFELTPESKLASPPLAEEGEEDDAEDHLELAHALLPLLLDEGVLVVRVEGGLARGVGQGVVAAVYAGGARGGPLDRHGGQAVVGGARVAAEAIRGG